MKLGRQPAKPPTPSARRRRKPTWGIYAFYSRVNAEARRDWRSFRKTLRPGIERDTGLMPWIIADSVVGEVARYFNLGLPERYSDWLDAKAERQYARPRDFRKLVREPDRAGREWLFAFMRHWLAHLLYVERPDLARRLPPGFGWGRPMPPAAKPEPPKPWHGTWPWDAQRVLKHPSWAWLNKVQL